MNNFKNTIDKITLDENNKRKMLNNILNYKEKKKNFTFKQIIIATCTFILAFSLTIGTGYALVKYFKLDNKVKNLLDLDDTTVEQIDGTDLTISKDFDDVTITINQTIVTENDIYINLDLISKNNEKYFTQAYLSKGSNFDDSIVKTYQEDDNSITYTLENSEYSSYGMSLISENENTNSYLLEFSYKNVINYSGDMTLRIYFSDNTYYDITFNLQANNIKSNKKDIKKVFYNENNLKLETNYISISTYNVIINYNSSNNDILENFDEYGYQFKNYYVTYKDGTKENLYLSLNYNKNDDGTYNSIFGYKSWFQNIDNIKSITINDVTFEM